MFLILRTMEKDEAVSLFLMSSKGLISMHNNIAFCYYYFRDFLIQMALKKRKITKQKYSFVCVREFIGKMGIEKIPCAKCLCAIFLLAILLMNISEWRYEPNMSPHIHSDLVKPSTEDPNNTLDNEWYKIGRSFYREARYKRITNHTPG